MNKKPNIIFLLGLVMLMMLISGCEVHNARRADQEDRREKIEIYDENGNKVYETENQKVNEYFASLVGDSVENIGEEKSVIIGEVPQDAEIAYHYVITTKRKNHAVIKRSLYSLKNYNLYTYKNYPYITLKGDSRLGSITWELSEEENRKIKNIDEIASFGGVN